MYDIQDIIKCVLFKLKQLNISKSTHSSKKTSDNVIICAKISHPQPSLCMGWSNIEIINGKPQFFADTDGAVKNTLL